MGSFKDQLKKDGKLSNQNNSSELLIEPYAYGTDKKRASKYDKEQWRKWAKETGFTVNKSLPGWNTVAGQNKQFQDHLMKHPDFQKTVEELHSQDQGFGMPRAGVPNDALLGERWDKIITKLTSKPSKTKIADTPKLAEDKKTEDTSTRKVIVSHGDPEKERQYPPVKPEWWLQDKLSGINAGLNYLGVKPYYPWEPMANYEQVRPTYLSPERALAENQSQMNMQLGMLSQFVNPKAFNARASEIFGKGFANAANVIGDVHNRNVGTANEFEQTNVGIRNQEQKENLAHATSLWDKYQATRQNFDNAKRQAADAMFNVAKNAVTNRAYTYNLNQINPQFAVDPNTGGTLYFHDPNDLKPSQSPTSLSDAYALKLGDPRFTSLANSESGRQILWNMTQKEQGIQTDDAMDQYSKTRNIPGQQVPFGTYPTQE
jgi:hypothetical protein